MTSSEISCVQKVFKSVLNIFEEGTHNEAVLEASRKFCDDGFPSEMIAIFVNEILRTLLRYFSPESNSTFMFLVNKINNLEEIIETSVFHDGLGPEVSKLVRKDIDLALIRGFCIGNLDARVFDNEDRNFRIPHETFKVYQFQIQECIVRIAYEFINIFLNFIPRNYRKFYIPQVEIIPECEQGMF